MASVNAKEDPHDPYKHFFNETWGNMPEEVAKANKVYVGTKTFKGKVVAIGFEPLESKDSASIYPVDIEFDTGSEVLRAGLSVKSRN